MRFRVPPAWIVADPAPSIVPKFQLSVPPEATVKLPPPVRPFDSVSAPPLATVSVAPAPRVIWPTVAAVEIDG